VATVSLDADPQADPQAGLQATLPGRYYVDPGLFEQERSRIFEGMWVAVARAAECAEPGRYATVDVGGENVLLIRGRDGVLRAFLNVCRHRGARLCTDSGGQLRRTLRCPYHGWTYGLDGALAVAPNLGEGGMTDRERDASGLLPVALREWLGYVWVCVAERPPSFEDTVVAAVAERLGDATTIDRWGLDRLTVGRRIRYDVRANWKLVVENFMECYHCACIHPELVRVLPEFSKGYAAQYFVGHGAEFAPEVSGFTVDGRLGFDPLPGIDADRDRRYYALTIRPQMFVNLVPDHAIVHRLYPAAPNRTIVDCDWLYADEVVASGADLSASVELFDRVNRQDFDACERCQPAMSSRAYANGGVLVPTEHHLAGFHRWITEVLADGLPTATRP
jgi:Rieske 2Fe-2S family protein